MKCCDVTEGKPSKKSNFLLLGIIKMFFDQCEMSLCVLWPAVFFAWSSPMMPFLITAES